MKLKLILFLQQIFLTHRFFSFKPLHHLTFTQILFGGLLDLQNPKNHVFNQSTNNIL